MEETQENKSKNGDTTSCASLALATANAQGRVWEQSKYILPSYCPLNLSPPPAQGIASTDSNRAAQKRQSRSCFNNSFGTLVNSTFLLYPKHTVLFVTSLQGKTWVWP